MGVWGHNNFECDVALNEFSAAIAPMLEAITDAFRDRKQLEPDEYESAAALCNMDMVVALAKLGGRKGPLFIGDFPKPKLVEQWRKIYLKVWDGYINELEPTEGFKRARRDAITKTFDRFVELAKRYEAV